MIATLVCPLRGTFQALTNRSHTISTMVLAPVTISFIVPRLSAI